MAQVFQKIIDLAVGSSSEDDDSSDGQSSFYTSDSSEDSRAVARRKRQIAAANAKLREETRQYRERDLASRQTGGGGSTSRNRREQNTRSSSSSNHRRATSSTSRTRGGNSSGGSRSGGGSNNNTRERRSNYARNSHGAPVDRNRSSRDLQQQGTERSSSKNRPPSSHGRSSSVTRSSSHHHLAGGTTSSGSNRQHHRRTSSQQQREERTNGSSREDRMDAMINKLGGSDIDTSDDDDKSDDVIQESHGIASTRTSRPKSRQPSPMHTRNSSTPQRLARTYDGRVIDQCAPNSSALHHEQDSSNLRTNAFPNKSLGAAYSRTMGEGEERHKTGTSGENSSPVYNGHKYWPTTNEDNLRPQDTTEGFSSNSVNTHGLSKDAVSVSDRYTSFQRGDASVASESLADSGVYGAFSPAYPYRSTARETTLLSQNRQTWQQEQGNPNTNVVPNRVPQEEGQLRTQELHQQPTKPQFVQQLQNQQMQGQQLPNSSGQQIYQMTRSNSISRRLNNDPQQVSAHMAQTTTTTSTPLNQAESARRPMHAQARKRLGSQSRMAVEEDAGTDPKSAESNSAPQIYTQRNIAQVTPSRAFQGNAAPDHMVVKEAINNGETLVEGHTTRRHSQTGIGSDSAAMVGTLNAAGQPQKRNSFVYNPTKQRMQPPPFLSSHSQSSGTLGGAAAPQALETSLSYSQSEQEGSSSINSSSHMSYSQTSNSDYMGVGDDDRMISGEAESRLIALVKSDQTHNYTEVMNSLLKSSSSRSSRKKRPQHHHHKVDPNATIPKGIYKKTSVGHSSQENPAISSNHENPIVKHASSSDASEASSLTEEDELLRRRGFLIGSSASGNGASDPQRSAPSPVMEEAEVPANVPTPLDDITNSTPSDLSQDLQSRSTASPPRESPKRMMPRLGYTSLAARSNVQATLLVPLSTRPSNNNLQQARELRQPTTREKAIVPENPPRSSGNISDEDEISLAASLLESEEDFEAHESSPLPKEQHPDTNTAPTRAPDDHSNLVAAGVVQDDTSSVQEKEGGLQEHDDNSECNESQGEGDSDSYNDEECSVVEDDEVRENIEAPSPTLQSHEITSNVNDGSSSKFESIISRRKAAVTTIQKLFRGFLTREDLVWETGIALRKSLEHSQNEEAVSLYSAIRIRAIELMESRPAIVTGVYLSICKVCATQIQVWFRQCLAESREKIEREQTRLLEEAAATKIQQLVRRSACRDLMVTLYSSVIQIQAFARQVIAQNRFFVMLEEEYSAITCQACIRGWLLRLNMERRAVASDSLQHLSSHSHHASEEDIESEAEAEAESGSDSDSEAESSDESEGSDHHEAEEPMDEGEKLVEHSASTNVTRTMEGFGSFGNFSFDNEDDFVGFDSNNKGKDFGSFGGDPFETPREASWTTTTEESTPVSSLDFPSLFGFESSDDFNLSSFAEQTMSRKGATDKTHMEETNSFAFEINGKANKPPPPPFPPTNTVEGISAGRGTQEDIRLREMRQILSAPPPPPPPLPPSRRASSFSAQEINELKMSNDIQDDQSATNEPGSSPRYPRRKSSLTEHAASSSLAPPARLRRAQSDCMTPDDAAKGSQTTSIVLKPGSALLNKRPPAPTGRRAPSKTSVAEQRRAVAVTPPAARALPKRSQSVGSIPPPNDRELEKEDADNSGWKGWDHDDDDEADDQDDEFDKNKRRPKMRSSLLQKNGIGHKIKKNLIPSGFVKSRRSSSSNLSALSSVYVPPKIEVSVHSSSDDKRQCRTGSTNSNATVSSRSNSVVTPSPRSSSMVTPSPNRKLDRSRSLTAPAAHQVTPRPFTKPNDRSGKKLATKKLVSPDSVQQTSNWGES